jgi:hypothetical protein
VDPAEHAGVVEKTGKKGVAYDAEIGDAEKLGHHEGADAHDRRGDAPSGGGDGLHGGGELRPVAEPLHQRDGVASRDHDVCHRASRDASEQGAGHHCGLCGPSGIFSRYGEGDVDEGFPSTGGGEKGAEDDEHGDERGRHARDAAVDSEGGVVEGAEDEIEADPLQFPHTGEGLAGKDVAQQENDHEGDGRSHGPPGGLEDEEHQGSSENQVEVCCPGGAHVDVKRFEKSVEVCGEEDCDQEEVKKGNALFGRFILSPGAEGKVEKADGQAESDVDRPELDVQETCEVYGGKELENGEKEAEGEDDLCLDPTD